MQDAERAMFPYVAINPTDGYYSPTKDAKYPSLQQRLYENLNDIVLGRQPFSYLDQVTKEWLDNGGSQMRTEFEREIAAARAWLTPGPQGRTAAIRTSVACRASRSPRLASGASTSSGRAPN